MRLNIMENVGKTLDFQASEHLEEQWRFLLQSAVLAPSACNSQPWIWETDCNDIKLYADRNRMRPVADPDGRELHLSCGASLMHLRLALRHFGYRGHVEYLPDERDPHLLARVSFGERQAPTLDEDLLYYAISRRHTNRGKFEQRAVPETVLTALAHEADSTGAWLHLIEDESDRGAVVDLVAKGDTVQWHSRDFRDEHAHWIRPSHTRAHDGIPGNALGMGSMASYFASMTMRSMDMGDHEADKDWILAGSAPVLAVLGTQADSPRQWLRAGEAMARVLLRACAANIDVSFFNQPVQVAGLWPELRRIMGRCGFPQLVFRLGYAMVPAVATPRRTPQEVMTHNAALYEVAESFRIN